MICAEDCDYGASYVPVPQASVESAGVTRECGNVGPEAFGILATAACRCGGEAAGRHAAPRP